MGSGFSEAFFPLGEGHSGFSEVVSPTADSGSGFSEALFPRAGSTSINPQLVFPTFFGLFDSLLALSDAKALHPAPLWRKPTPGCFRWKKLALD
jgi:hypothetical protein